MPGSSSGALFDGGSEADRARLLELHRTYLDANDRLDAETLRQVWDTAASNVFFNLNGHTYTGFAQWERLWLHYRGQFETLEPWVSRDVKLIVRGDMAVLTCERSSRLRWIGEEPVAAFAERALSSRSTEVFTREGGDWRVVHVHFSPVADTPRPGGI